MRVGVLTGGGDCPGLNACVRGVVGRAVGTHGVEVVGIRNGWEGLMHGHTVPLDRDAVRGVIGRGGTFLGTSRADPYVHGDGYASVRRTIDHIKQRLPQAFVIAGNVAGLGGYFVGQAVGDQIASRWPDQNEHTSVFITTGFAYTGAAFATAGGVYAVGSIGDQRGSFSATMLGAGVGAGVAWVLDRTLFADGDDSASGSRTRWTQTLLNSTLPSIGATIGFNSSRRFQ